MPNQAPDGHDEQITVAPAESATLIAISEKAACLAPAVDVQAGENNTGEPKREISFLGECLRLAGGTVGFLMGGPAGAAVGSAVGQLAGDIAAERTSLFWPALGRAFLYPKRTGLKQIVLISMAMTAAIPGDVGVWLQNCRPLS